MNIQAKQVKAIFFDIDNTLFDHKIFDFPASAKQALHALAEKGFGLYIATSRSEQEMEHVWDALAPYPFRGIISNGGAMTRLNGKIIDQLTIDAADCANIIAFCEKNNIDVRWQSEEYCMFHQEARKETVALFQYLYGMEPGIRRWNDDAVLNMLVYANKEQAKEMEGFICNASQLHMSRVEEITAKNVNKASAVLELAKREGYQVEELAAFGDGENDVEMLKSVGVGIAMGNGGENVKRAADYITSPIMEDGILRACRMMGWIE